MATAQMPVGNQRSRDLGAGQRARPCRLGAGEHQRVQSRPADDRAVAGPLSTIRPQDLEALAVCRDAQPLVQVPAPSEGIAAHRDELADSNWRQRIPARAFPWVRRALDEQHVTSLVR